MIVPRLSWPLTLDGATLATVEQDSLEEIAQCVALVVSTGVGTRVELPDYGIDDPIGSRDLHAGEVLAAVGTWEPRAVADDNAADVIDGLGTLVVNLL